MGFFSNIFKKKETVTGQPESSYVNNSHDLHFGRTYNSIVPDSFDGEKTPGELGDILDTVPDYLGLRLRAYDLNLKTDIIRVITGKFFKWVIGSGLKLQAEPNAHVLGMSNIEEDLNKFQKDVEALFMLYSKSHYSDYHKKDNLHDKAAEAFNASFLGGDCLWVIRADEFGVNVQVIDGQQVQTPLDESLKEQGNTIKHGIELDKKGEHIAFWVCVKNEDGTGEHKRIKAKNTNGNIVAKMIYGDKARIDHHRGIPKIAAILEKVTKLDRYVEASVSKAEQTANVVYSIEHDEHSTGENPLMDHISAKKKNDDTCETTFEKTGRTANQLRQTTSGTVMNLPTGAKLASLSAQSETQFNEFFRAVFVVLCASVDIPEEVALQKYEQNYSSSRAAINGWEFLIEIYREKFARDFYQPFYRVWLEYNILTDRIKSNGFLRAKSQGDFMALEAYYNARFLGKKMPHIDPLKEAKAIREMLGDDRTALISREQAAEELGAGDWRENYNKYEQENDLIPKEDAETENID